MLSSHLPRPPVCLHNPLNKNRLFTISNQQRYNVHAISPFPPITWFSVPIHWFRLYYCSFNTNSAIPPLLLLQDFRLSSLLDLCTKDPQLHPTLLKGPISHHFLSTPHDYYTDSILPLLWLFFKPSQF